MNEKERREQIDLKQKAMLEILIASIEKNPTRWEKGWYAPMPSYNAASMADYQGLNALFLNFAADMRGYKDPRWITYNQAKNLGGNIKKDEKSVPVFFWRKYDKKTKSDFNDDVLDGMTYEAQRDYLKQNVQPIPMYFQVFNAEQCENLPEKTIKETVSMSAEEQAQQNSLIEKMISKSEAPIRYDGRDRAYYSPYQDEIHLPEVSSFKTMNDYYATALHEMAHSTGHASRLNRKISNGFGTPEYAVEELRAELSSVFLQQETGIRLEDAQVANHGAYLASWLKAVKEDNNVFFRAATDASKISNYIAEHYIEKDKTKEASKIKEQINNEKTGQILQENSATAEKEIPKQENESTVETEPVKYDATAVFSEQVDAVLSGADTTSTHLKVMDTPLIFRQIGAQNLPVLMTAKHLRNIVAESGTDNGVNYHNIDPEIIKKLPELLADPVIIMDSMTKPDSVVMLTSAVDKENRPIIGAIKFDGRGNLNDVEIDANILTSTYGKDNFTDFIKINAEKNTILYWSKEKSQMLATPGLQLPDNLKTLDSNVIIRKANAFVNSSFQKETGLMDAAAADIAEDNRTALPDNETLNGQVKQVKQARQVGQVEQVKITLPIESKLKEYGKATMLRMPKDAVEFASFVFLAPTKFLKDGEKGVELKMPSGFELALKNDGIEVKLSGSELRAVLDGKESGKSAQRVSASKRNAAKLAALRENVPSEMQGIPNWCVYRTKWNEEKNKKEKFILSAVDLNTEKLPWAEINKPETWTTFERALEAAEKYNCEGIAIALDGNGITCVDLDRCIVKNGELNGAATDKHEGEKNETAKKLEVEFKGTYTEKSASGNGLHFFVKDDVLAGGKYANRVTLPNGDEIEVYDNARFISMTGDVQTLSKELSKCPTATTAYLRQTLGQRQAVDATVRSTSNTPRNVDLRYQSDAEVIERIRNSKAGAKFDTLFNGGAITGDKSRDDFAMLNTLAFFTDCNESQMDSIFRASARFRPEEKNSAYLPRSIKRACETLSTRIGQHSAGSGRGKGK